MAQIKPIEKGSKYSLANLQQLASGNASLFGTKLPEYRKVVGTTYVRPAYDTADMSMQTHDSSIEHNTMPIEIPVYYTNEQAMEALKTRYSRPSKETDSWDLDSENTEDCPISLDDKVESDFFRAAPVSPVAMSVRDIAMNAVYGFIDTYRNDLAKATTGVKGYFARRELKKKLHECVHVNCWGIRTDYETMDEVNKIADSALEALIPRSKEMSDAYNAEGRSRSSKLKGLVEGIFMLNDYKNLDEGAVSAMQKSVADSYVRPTEVVAEQRPAPKRSWFAKAVGACALVAATILPASAAVQQYRIADDVTGSQEATVMMSDYSIDAREKPAAAAPAASPRRHVAAGTRAASPQQARYQHQAINEQFPQFQLEDLSRPLIRGPMPYMW
jgi:hypothetical protein